MWNVFLVIDVQHDKEKFSIDLFKNIRYNAHFYMFFFMEQLRYSLFHVVMIASSVNLKGSIHSYTVQYVESTQS